MCNCRRRKCMALNMSCKYNENEYEKLCNNLPSDSKGYNNNCSCGFDEEDDGFPANPMYAQSYVPMQVMNNTFKPCVGLSKGTIFPELVSPYCPGDSMAEIDYIKNANNIKEGCNR